MSVWEKRVNRLVAAQAHAVSARQVLWAGGTRNAIQAKLVRGAWVRVAPGVYCPAGMEHGGWRQQLWIAHLAAGPLSVVSHESAAELHGLPQPAAGLVTLLTPLGTHARVAGALFREVRDLRAEHVRRKDGLPVTTPARTIVDLAGRRSVSRKRLDDLVVVAHRAGLVDVADVAKVTRDVRQRGKPGIAKLDAVFAERAPGASIPASRLEEMLYEVIGSAGLGNHVVYQHPLPTLGSGLGYVDAAVPSAKLILEADGRRWHSQEQDMAQDRERDNGAAALGWLTMRFTYQKLVADPQGAVAQIRAAYDARVAAGGRVAAAAG